MNVVRGTLAIGLLAAGLGAFAACSSEGGSESSAASSPSATVLEVRGVIRQLPRQAAVPLLIEHEAIPDFVDINGNRAPMDTMTMPFAVADDVSLGGLEVGDPVVFTLEIDWQTSPSILITAIQELPAGTTLEVGTPGETDTDLDGTEPSS